MNWKLWNVYGTYGTFYGTVRAPRKYLAMMMAERDFKLAPGTFYLGLA